MGLFDKKYCDVCGEKIGFLGNKKLKDGNLCKECSNKLSPFFHERRNSTVEEIKAQLIYREENKLQLKNFSPELIFGNSKKIYIDRNNKKFIVSSLNWRECNADIISFSDVISVDKEISKNKSEIYYKDENNKTKSYNPPRYEYEYMFNLTINVNSPWFNKIELEISDGNRPESVYTDLYREYEKEINTIFTILNCEFSKNENEELNVLNSLSKDEKNKFLELIKFSTWKCKTCGNSNLGEMVCKNCGSKFNDEEFIKIIKNISFAQNFEKNSIKNWKCEYCGSNNSGNFCTNCGASHD